MIAASCIHAAVLILLAWWISARLGRRLSVSLLLFGAMWLIHGIPLQLYVHWTGPDTLIFERTLGAESRDVALARLINAVSVTFAFMALGSEAASLTFKSASRRGQRALQAQGSGPVFRTIRLDFGFRAAMWVVLVAMLAVSVVEGQAGKVVEYFAFGESELARILLRAEGGGTPYYAYNLILYSVAPYLFMLAWCADRRRVPMLACLLFLAVMLGKFGTLSKAPPVIFLLQLVLLRVLLLRASMRWKTVAVLLLASAGLFAAIVSLTIADLDLRGLLRFLYYRAFDIPNESLLEFFSAIPSSIPHGGGAGIFSLLRPEGDYLPMYSRVAELNRGSLDSTSNAMFAADAWAEFGWSGIVIFAFIAGGTVRSIDILAQRDGDTDASACLVAGCSFGVFTALSTALPTAYLTGGLAVLPALMLLTTQRRRSPNVGASDSRAGLAPGS